MRLAAFLASLLGVLVALGAAAVAVVLVWPSLRARVVADLKAEVKAQNVVGDAVGDVRRAIGF